MRQIRVDSTFLILFLLTSCTALGVQPLTRPPHTVQESLYVASESGKGMTTTFTQLRVDRLITQDVYDKVIADLQIAHDATEQGLTLYQAGNYSGAATVLDKVQITLQAIAAILAQVEASKSNGAHM